MTDKTPIKSQFQKADIYAPTPSLPQEYFQGSLENKSESGTGLEYLLSSYEGYIVGRLNNELLRYPTDTHLLTISPTGGGKTTGVIIPNIIDHPGSIVAVDIRGETVSKTAHIKQAQGYKVVVLDPYQITKGKWGIHSYNPFERIIKNRDDIRSDDMIQRLVKSIMADPLGRTSNEPIWDNATEELLTGLISYIVYYAEPFKQNLNELFSILNFTEAELVRFINEINNLLAVTKDIQNNDKLKGLLKILTNGKSNTKITDNAIYQAKTLLSWVSKKAFGEIVRLSTFSFDELQNQKTITYLVIPEEYIDNCATWTRVMIESAVFSINDVHSSYEKSTSELGQDERVLFLLDELPALGQLDLISKNMATLRGRGINLWLFVQNLAQLEDIYGEKKARSILGNAAAVQAFNSTELEELEYFVRMIGEDYLDVQSIGFGETQTETQTETSGTSHTISNSSSFSETIGLSDSITETLSDNWSNSKSIGSSTSSGITKTRGNSHGESSGNSSSETYHDRNLIFSNKRDSENDGRNWSENSSSSKSKSFSSSKGNSKNEAFTKGGGQSSGIGKTNSKSTSNTTQNGFSDTRSVSNSYGKSLAVNRNITVKKERMKIETVRSLREKLHNRNQLIQIKGFQPFFTPRMSYFAKFSDHEAYMFPDIASTISRESFQEIMIRLENFQLDKTTKILQSFDRYNVKFEDLTNNIDEWKEANDNLKRTNAQDSIMQYAHFFKSFSINFFESVDNYCKELNLELLSFKEPIKALRAIINLLRFNNELLFNELDGKLIQNSLFLEKGLTRGLNDSTIILKYQTLPLEEDKHRMDWGYSSNHEKNAAWLVRIYASIVLKHMSNLENIIQDIHRLHNDCEKLKQSLLSIGKVIWEQYQTNNK